MSFIKRRKKKSTKASSKSTIDNFLKEEPDAHPKPTQPLEKTSLQKTKLFLMKRQQKLKEAYKKTILKATNQDDSAKPEKILGGDFKRY